MGDTGKHLTSFKVENFKRFESFEMEDLGQFNLIVGDNNTGKTSVLEALLINEDVDQTINSLIGALKFRNLIKDFFYQEIELYKNVKSTSKSFHVEYKLQNSDQTEQVKLSMLPRVLEFYIKGTKLAIDPLEATEFSPRFNFPFIPFYRGHDEDMTRFYGELQKDRVLKDKFFNNLKVIVPELDIIELTRQFDEPHLIVFQKHLNQSIPLAFFGDGVLKLFRLLAEIILNKGNRLMIDEVDAGIHYSRFKKFWKTVLLAAKENDVQLFMTTHNEECIKYFKEVIETELPELRRDARSITLIETPEREVKALTYTFDQLEANIEIGNEIRGGAR